MRTSASRIRQRSYRTTARYFDAHKDRLHIIECACQLALNLPLSFSLFHESFLPVLRYNYPVNPVATAPLLQLVADDP